jgi:hypothetical protein
MRISMRYLRGTCGFKPQTGDHYLYQDPDTEFYISIHGIDATDNRPDVTSITIKKRGWQNGIGYAVAPNGNLHLGRGSRTRYGELSAGHKEVVDRLRDEAEDLFRGFRS